MHMGCARRPAGRQPAVPVAIVTLALAAIAPWGAAVAATETAAPPARTVEIRVLSSRPDQVSGGDVLLRIEAPAALHHELTLRLDGRDIGSGALRAGSDALLGLLDGLADGENTLEVRHPAHGRLAQVVLVNHPITGPMFSGPQQYPFVCSVVHELGVQPLVDAPEPPGFRVHDDEGTVIGYSRDCSVEPVIDYWYRTTAGEWAPWPEDGAGLPADIASAVTLDGDTVPFVVRWERGTINRFIYSYAALTPPQAIGAEDIDASLWNGRLLYHFQGGVGVGHTQGRVSRGNALRADQLALGYAVAYSTGTRTGEHYNLQVGGETALMVKEHFIKRYGVPLYTVGLGGSGGAIQQYVYHQNHPGLIDAGVAVQSYPDMVTQVIHISDCELLEHFMDATDRGNRRWRETANRSLLVGLNATDMRPDPLAILKRVYGYSTAPGSTECVASWRGIMPVVLNPHFGRARHAAMMAPPGIMEQVNWTHLDDLRNVYGLDEDGWPRVPLDNVGVQYGLRAVASGRITPDEFLKLNALVGSWKHPRDKIQEGFPYITRDPAFLIGNPGEFDPWSRRNMRLSPDAETAPAPRAAGDLDAIRAVYRAGMVYDGQLDIPLIDWRLYLEHRLDMHNSHQSFAIRQRIRERMGHADHHVIWFTDGRPEPRADFRNLALEVIEAWLHNVREYPGRSLAANRPESAVDSCFTTEGELIARGNRVWSGILDEAAPGACTQKFPLYSTSRIEAGGPITGNVFKCRLQTVASALAKGLYGGWTPDAGQLARLKRIFPGGVCDYSLPDAGRPADLDARLSP
jgi:hypothetical protein